MKEERLFLRNRGNPHRRKRTSSPRSRIPKPIAVLLVSLIVWGVVGTVGRGALAAQAKGFFGISAGGNSVEADGETNRDGNGDSVSQEEENRQSPFEVPSYEALYPDLYAPAAAYGSVKGEKVVYLTFDDGPSGRTDEILDVLDYFGVKATFFVVGKEGDRAAERMREIVSRGHMIGMHTYSHDYPKVYQSVESFLEDYDRIYRLIKGNTGVSPTIFRFPGGSVNDHNAVVYENIVAEMTRRGFVYFDWNAQIGDAADPVPSVSQMVKNATAKTGTDGRVILLMHDSVNMYNTVEALPRIIQAYQKAGFTFEVLTPEVKPIQFAFASDLSSETK